MGDLAEFLLARISEDEEGACLKGEPGRDWHAHWIAECEAKRQIVERALFVDGHGPAVDHVRALDMSTGAAAALRDVLRFLALPYADHPDYREEWKP